MSIVYPTAWERTLVQLAQEARRSADAAATTQADAALLTRAYACCDTIIAEHGKTFNLASSLRPAAKKRAIRALYAVCRVADNIVDEGEADVSGRAAQLAAWRERALMAVPPRDDPAASSGQALVAIAWADTRRRYRVPPGYCAQLLDGVARDLRQDRYQTFADLATYAYSVASTVGLMSLRIIGPAPGYREEDALPFAIKLGLALQLTNILRDVGEDWRAGRVYLPADELQSGGLSEADLARGQVTPRWRDFMRYQIARTRALYREAWPCIAMFHRDGRFAVAAACTLYSAILGAIEANDYDVFHHRAHVPTGAKLRRLPAIWWATR
jgi:phytoene synthase